MTEQLDKLIAEIEKEYGKGSFSRVSDYKLDIQAIPTGALAFDLASGIMGFPRGRMTEIYGPESSGKTTLVLSAIAEAQRRGGLAALIDAEHALDPEWATKCGVDIDALYLNQPQSGEEALNIAEAVVRSGLYSLVAIDSIAALTPLKELEGDVGDSFVGQQARMMGQALRKMNAAIHTTNTAVIFVNQLREKVGVMFGSPETTPGGKAMKYFASMRVDVRRTDTIKDGQVAVGSLIKAKFVKNKCAPPFRTALFEIIYDEGISRAGSTIDLAVELGVVKKGGAWLTWGDNRYQGRNAFKEVLRDFTLLDRLQSEVLAKVTGAALPVEVE